MDKIDTSIAYLVDLDCLLDTRLGTIAAFDESIATALAQNPLYVNRLFDDFSHLIKHPDWKDEDYRASYAARNINTLSFSRMTPILFNLGKLMLSAMYEVETAPDRDEVSLDINFYPYELTRGDVQEVLAAINYYLPEQVRAKYTYVPIKDMTYAFIRPRYTTWFTYAFDDWFQLGFAGQGEETILREAMPRFEIITPPLFTSKQSYVDYLAFVKEAGLFYEKHDPFVDLSVSMVPYFKLTYAPISDFTIISDSLWDFRQTYEEINRILLPAQAAHGPV